MFSFILASNSPRRIELLRQLTPDFKSVASAVEEAGSILEPERQPETLPLPKAYQISPDAHPTLWAWRKASDVALSLLPDDGHDVVVLGADTVVIGQGALLGKPQDEARARAMLEALRGRKHYVATGYALLKRKDGEVETLHAGAILSEVWMRDYTDIELMGYVATGEPLDKAGAYAVQGLGGRLVARVEGCYNNVVGLPLCAVRQALEAAGVEVLPYPEGEYCSGCLRRGRV